MAISSATRGSAPLRPLKKVRLGTIHADVISFNHAIDRIVDLARSGQGGFVVTPNVDHVVLAEENTALRAAYAGAALSLVDGMPLVWMARALGHPFPEKVSGSDLVEPLMRRAALEGLRVYILGGMPGVGAKAAAELRDQFPGLVTCGVDAPPLGFEKDPPVLRETLARCREAQPDIVLVALGCPKQELFMHAHAAELAPAVLLGIGASVDFIAGTQRRSPRWMSMIGLEWMHRLAQDPKRMTERYLVRDRAIAGVFMRMLRTPKDQRAF